MTESRWILLYLSLVNFLLRGEAQIGEIARRRVNHASQGSTRSDNTADRALDGETDPNYSNGHCAWVYQVQLDGIYLTWWMVDLGSEYAIYNVTIYSGYSIYRETYLGYISVRVSDSARIVNHTVTDQCALWDDDRFPEKSQQTLICDEVKYGRYVSIQRTGGDDIKHMILCEVMIMGRELDTDCDNCNDDDCVPTASCRQCNALKPPECREGCDANRYGVNCKYKCSDGCEEACDLNSGRCTCKDWWDGSRCSTKIELYDIPRYRATITDRTDSSAVVTWKTIEDLPDTMKQYYWYELEYRLETESEWIVHRTLEHDPVADGTQQYTLTGLQYNSVYRVQVRSVRILRGLTDTTGTSPVAQFNTRCREPDKPVDMAITHQGIDNKVTLSVTWKALNPRCSHISALYIEYRLSSASDTDWQRKDLASSATSATLSDLDPGAYIVRLTVTNNDGLTSFSSQTYTTSTTDDPTDTDCQKCDDVDRCETTGVCQTCTAGYKPPQCKNKCDPGDCGINCGEECSEGCEDTCDHKFGTCSCHQWWKGSKCNTEIRALRILSEPPTKGPVTESTAVIKWKKISSVPADLGDNYVYVIEYKEETSSSWVEWPIRYSHDPSSDQYQEATLTALMYNTVYDVRVKSFRVLGGDREETGVTGMIEVQTECTAPSKPRNVLMTVQDSDNKMTFNITWKHPEVVGCNSIAKYAILYRLESAPSDSWNTDATLSASSKSHIFELDKGEYVVRVVVTNDGSSDSSYAEAWSRPWDTDCTQCFDNKCESTAACQTCMAGYKPSECRKNCYPGDYGINCAEDCSKGCEGVCDLVSGTCNCHRWWKGNKCTMEIRALQIPADVPKTSSLTDSSAVIGWRKIPNVPAELSGHYQYVIEYKEDTSSSWLELLTRHSHDPSSDQQYQEATLTGLVFNTVYDVRVKSYRVLGDDKEKTGATGENKFQTQCTTPSAPRDVSVTLKDHDSKRTVDITWEHPKIVGCNRIVEYTILYRPKSAPSDSWTTDATLPGSSTSHTLELDKGDYVVRVVVTNDGGHGTNNYAEASYGTSGSSDNSSFPMWVVGVIVSLLLVIVLVIVVFVFLMRRMKQLKQNNETPQVKKSTEGHEEAFYEEIVGKHDPGYTGLRRK